MKPEQYAECQIDVNGWPVRLTTYKLGEVFHAIADNVSPGATLARMSGATPEEARLRALGKAERLLARTHRQAV